VRLPAGAAVSKATLSTQESLLADRAGTTTPPGSCDSRNGVHIGAAETTAVGVALAEAISATGVALPLVALAAGSEVSVELQEDFQSAPSGKKLAAGTAKLAAPGVVKQATIFFDPVVLASGPIWVVLRAAKGEAVWLTASAGGGSLRVRRTVDGDSAVETVLPDLAPVYELFSRSGHAVGTSATTLAVGTTTIAAHRDGDKTTYDLAAALQPLAAAGGTIPLTFTAAVAGTITIFPPHLEYEF
jgi:hypothetical protein